MASLLRCAVVAVALILAGLPGSAPAAADSQEDITISELEDLVSAIEDDGERAILVQRLKALIELKKTQREEAGPEDRTLGALLIEQLEAHSEAFGRQLSAFATALLNAPGALRDLGKGLSDPETRQRWIVGLLALITVVGVGLIVSRLVRRLLKRPLAAISHRPGESLLVLMPLLAARLVLILIPPIAFAGAGWAAVSFFGADSIARPIALSVVYAVAIAGAINAVARAVLAPAAAATRLMSIGDETAQYAYIWIRRVTDLAVYGYFGIQVAGYLGLSAPAQSLLTKVVGLALVLLLIMLIMQNRKPVADAIGGAGEGRFAVLRRRLSDLWHVLAILYLSGVYLVWAIDMPGGFAYVIRATVLSLLTVSVAMAVLGFIVRLIDKAFALTQEVKERHPQLETRVNRYLPAIKTVARVVVWTIAALAVLQAWGIDILLWLNESTGRALLSRLASVSAIVLLALIGWEAISAAIERYLASEDAANSQRARTLLPLIRKVVLVALTVVVGLTVLSELGINIAPLLAGAGVVGLAVGFGAQTLVRDIITGLFILIEDTVSVGDFVTLAGHGGTVEALSIRSIRLRDPSGTVYTVPFSDVTSVINYTRDFAYAVVDIGVAYKEDFDAVSRVMEEVGAELRRDPDLGPSILEDLQVQGLDSFGDSAVVIKARMMTAPGKQWAVRRGYNRLLKRRFDAEGIEIPFPQQTVWFAEEDGTQEAKPALKGEKRKKSNSPAARSPGEGDLDGES